MYTPVCTYDPTTTPDPVASRTVTGEVMLTLSILADYSMMGGGFNYFCQRMKANSNTVLGTLTLVMTTFDASVNTTMRVGIFNEESVPGLGIEFYPDRYSFVTGDWLATGVPVSFNDAQVPTTINFASVASLTAGHSYWLVCVNV